MRAIGKDYAFEYFKRGLKCLLPKVMLENLWKLCADAVDLANVYECCGIKRQMLSTSHVPLLGSHVNATCIPAHFEMQAVDMIENTEQGLPSVVKMAGINGHGRDGVSNFVYLTGNIEEVDDRIGEHATGTS